MVALGAQRRPSAEYVGYVFTRPARPLVIVLCILAIAGCDHTSSRQARASTKQPPNSATALGSWCGTSMPTRGRVPAWVQGAPTFLRHIAGAHGEGRTVIAISHDMRFVAEAFERVVVMRAGRIVLDGAPERVFRGDAWGALASTFLEPPLAAVMGERLGLGSTPTDASLIHALSGWNAGAPVNSLGFSSRSTAGAPPAATKFCTTASLEDEPASGAAATSGTAPLLARHS